MADEKSVVEAVATATDRLSGLDLAFLNAGVGGLAPLLAMSADEWDRTHDVNLRGTFLCLERSGDGRIRHRRVHHVTALRLPGRPQHGALQQLQGRRGPLARIAAAELGPGHPGERHRPRHDGYAAVRKDRCVPGYRDAGGPAHRSGPWAAPTTWPPRLRWPSCAG